jgi:hypothetical protein
MSFLRSFHRLSGGSARFVAPLLTLAALVACSNPKGADSPGIELGAPGTRWAAKNDEQRFGFMAAQVHPVMTKVFKDWRPDRYPVFECSNCHGSRMEQIDYAMPNTGLYSLPKDRAYDDAIDYDAEVAVFMMTKVTPALQDLLNQGEGPPTKASCFSCHPVAD